MAKLEEQGVEMSPYEEGVGREPERLPDWQRAEIAEAKLREQSDIIDIAVWTHRWSEWLPRCAASVARYTRGNYNLIVVCEPGSCHQNMNKVLARSRGRYLVFLDEDVEILRDNWLSCLIDDLAGNGALGVVGCLEVKEAFWRTMYQGNAESFAKAMGIAEKIASAPVEEKTWIPAYVMAFDRSRYPVLCFDENIPGAKGMTDVDACLQLRKHGLKIACDNRVVVYHPHRRENERGRDGVPTKQDELEWFQAQKAYMTEKWGEMYTGDPTLCPQ